MRRLLDGFFAHRWWEEVLYRGFLLRALERLCGRADVATVASSLLFAAHHLSLTAALPLAALGATWSYLYLASGNLLVPVAIHALWNARVFAGTVLGL
jgi:membrane protease YdiL (CAAX protease family)